MENHNPTLNMDGEMNKYVAVPQQVQVGQSMQVQDMQTVQPQVQHIQQVQVPQIQQNTLPQVQQVQVQNSDGVTTTTQQVTIVNNTVPNTQSMGTLHDALTNRLNHNHSKVNSTVPTPSLVSVQTPTIQQQHQSKTQEPQPTQILTRARMQDLVREVDPNEQLDEDVEEILLQMADDFVESAITAACLLAKHRKSSTVEVKDLQLHLERNWNMWIPGFGTDELRPYKRSSVNDAHKQPHDIPTYPNKMSASSSEDEIDEALKESANCDYINDLVKPSKTKENSPEKSIRKSTSDVSVQDNFRESDFERFLAQRLAGRLEDSIKIVERKQKDFVITESSNGGIRLFSGSPVVSELTEDADVEPRKTAKPPVTAFVDYEGRAEASAVSSGWVKDVTNTSHWKDSKKPRLLETTVVKKHSNGGIECSPKM
ncbi:hypothetical protein GE061_019630 [Apolygus lucorum]|uniref:Transcription initiation factor TFIID subunit 12 n=1 Tax=Apolygus lucorum TaxID=248454 RepID=A0A8S9X8Y9_APOLU|nr:hypothetical protein GE061_019630 [Apolygus lucorum]